MRKKIFIFTVLLIILTASLAQAVEIKDLPKDHWAYQSVNDLVNKGLFSLYDDQTFRGNDKVSRYELAQVIGRLLENIQNGEVKATEQDIDLLRKLSIEFQEELVDLAVNGDIFKEQIKKIEQKNIIQDSDLAEIRDNVSADKELMKQDLNNLDNKINDRIDNIESDVTKIIDNILKIKQLEEEIAMLKNGLQISSIKVNKLEDELKRLNEEINIQNQKYANIKLEYGDNIIQQLEDRQTITSTRINTIQDELNGLKAQLNDNEKENSALKAKNNNYKQYLYGLAAISILSILISM